MGAMNSDLRLWGKSSDRSGLGCPYPLLGHLLDTAAAAGAVCDLIVPQNLKAAVGGQAGAAAWKFEAVFLAGAHDIGKATCWFQAQSTDCDSDFLLPNRTPDFGIANKHAYASGLLAREALMGGCLADLEHREAADRAAQVVAGHHGIIPSIDRDHQGRATSMLLKDPESLTGRLADSRESFLRTVADVTGSAVLDGKAGLPWISLSQSVVVLADWVASSEAFISDQAEKRSRPLDDEVVDFPDRWYKQAREVAERCLRDFGLVPPAARSVAAADVLPPTSNNEELEPSRLQASIGSDHPVGGSGITVIVAPTGEGKTEAGLLAMSKYAEGRGSGGWYFAMPTMGTADGLRERLEGLLPRLHGDDAAKPPLLHLLHSLSRLRDDPAHWGAATPEARDWMSGKKKALLAPYGVGTIDQVLMGVLRARHSPLRMLGTALSGVVVDEAHSFDPYMQTLLVRLLEWLGALGSPAVLLSATMPKAKIDRFVKAYQKGAGRPEESPDDCGYPGWVSWSRDSSEFAYPAGVLGPRRSWALRIDARSAASDALTDVIAESAVAAATPEGCVMVVRESVGKAQATFRAIKRAVGDSIEVVLLHARFRHCDRKRIADDLICRFGKDSDRPDRFILVATQVVEMSLDVDFDFLITDPAPLAATLQRSGRTHRHEGRRRPSAHQAPAVQVWWPKGADGSPSFKSRIYQEYDLRRALPILEANPEIKMPGDAQRVVDEADSDRDNSEMSDDGGEAWDAYLKWLGTTDVSVGKAKQSVIPSPDRNPKQSAVRGLTGPRDDEDVSGTRLGVKAVQVLPVWHSDEGDLLDSPGGKAISNKPGLDEEGRLFGLCIAVPRYPGKGSSWLDQLEKHPKADDQEGGRTAWNSGPLAHVRLLPMSDESISDAVDIASGESRRVSVSSVTGLEVLASAEMDDGAGGAVLSQSDNERRDLGEQRR